MAKSEFDALWPSVARERMAIAEMAEQFTDEQWSTPSLCGRWDVRTVIAHLLAGPTVGLLQFLGQMVRARGNFDIANDAVARKLALQPTDRLVALLRENAGHRFHPPGFGAEAPLTDLFVHGLDVRVPLGIDRALDPGDLSTLLTWLVEQSPRGFTTSRVTQGVRYRATDLDWAAGSGPEAVGTAQSVLLALTGRPAGLEGLSGEGADLLRTKS